MMVCARLRPRMGPRRLVRAARSGVAPRPSARPRGSRRRSWAPMRLLSAWSRCSALLERPKLAPPATPSRLRRIARLCRAAPPVLTRFSAAAPSESCSLSSAHSLRQGLGTQTYVNPNYCLCLLLQGCRGPVVPRASPPGARGPAPAEHSAPGGPRFCPVPKYWPPRVKICYVADQKSLRTGPGPGSRRLETGARGTGCSRSRGQKRWRGGAKLRD